MQNPQQLIEQLHQLSPLHQQEVADFIAFLCQKEKQEKPVEKPLRQPGLAKGRIIMAPDFDEPLEDFKEYM